MAGEIKINILDFNPDIAIGIALPITSGNSSIFNLNYTTFNQIKSDLNNLLMTEPGERFMLLEYGCGLKHKLFEQNSVKLQSDIDSIIRTAINRWMPYIIINEIDISTDLNNENLIRINIAFSTNSNPSEIDILTITTPIPSL